ncbi:PEPTIDYL-PROLYL CIS-TRANS ISOMERASE FKBP17-1 CHLOROPLASTIC [Salix purpurea]|uniref:Rotamase n=1 Tax=Salix purpurea TaxID=77065 RepID=A0A9Q0VGE5_SALPP|nr:PEPTIDYL-PROLYL CIS-TRANS ISOMERASE FKBP17-1 CHLOROPLASTIC [Salix purpurea]KAJ6748195.1 PEPTIDYL-PROLYL CIS-TRANS ISOMERASE FKBP17-1 CHLOROPLASTIC [Salix purpurea]
MIMYFPSIMMYYPTMPPRKWIRLWYCWTASGHPFTNPATSPHHQLSLQLLHYLLHQQEGLYLCPSFPYPQCFLFLPSHVLLLLLQLLTSRTSQIPAVSRPWIFELVPVQSFLTRETRLQYITMEGWQQNKGGGLIQHMITKTVLVNLFLLFSHLVLGRSLLGLKTAVRSMRVGGVRRVIIPPSQGYQNTTQEPLPPNFFDRQRLFTTIFNPTRLANGEGSTLGTLIFDNELVSLKNQ